MICPALLTGAPVALKRLVPGSPKFARFSRLYNSARNCRDPASPSIRSLVSLVTVKSKFATPGPIRVLRPTFPCQVPDGMPGLHGNCAVGVGLRQLVCGQANWVTSKY